MRRSKKDMLSDILLYLSTQDSRQTELSEKLHIHPSTTIDILKRLRANGMISMSGWVYSITGQGREFAAKIKEVNEVMEVIL